MKDFLRGFCFVTGLSRIEANEQWAWYSRQLSEKERNEIESGGYEAGIEEGNRFVEFYGEN